MAEEQKSGSQDEQKTDSGFGIGDLVWAKMSSFPAWPGRIVKPWKNVKKPAAKKPHFFVYFFGTEDHAWVKVESLKVYKDHKVALCKAAKGVKFQKAIEAIEEAIKDEENEKDKTLSPYHPDDDEDVFPKAKPMRDYSREAFSGVKKLSLSSGSEDKSKMKRKFTQPSDEDDDLEEEVRRKSPKKRGRQFRDADGPIKSPKKETPKKKPFEQGITPAKRKPKMDMDRMYKILFEHKQVNTNNADGQHPAIVPSSKRIGFVGLGIMGKGMAMNLVKSGHKVTVWNRTSEKCSEVVKAGATLGDSIADVVKNSDITFSMVSDPEALRAIVFGEKGVLDEMNDGKALVDCTTVDIGTVTGVSEAVANKGGRFLEAPVSGSIQPAVEGNLIFMAAGDKQLYDECESCFSAMGKKSFFLGDAGNGARMKLVLNMIMGSVVAGFSEGMALADKAGLNQADLLEVIDLGAMSCPLLRGKGKGIINNIFPPAFPLKHQQKDMRLALAMGDQSDQTLPVAASANELFKRAKGKGHSDSDMSAVYKVLIQ
ncbi:glyoxylate/succinic semialdehyde reductase 1-like isoform X2 [Anneissia japonica]|uniref:glyoxylate/succinic semialdehyde reductase 1-like isoform X2 n=1 Tax=Anneissia japonica TaxID=1529436 RepID=UPI001425B098|nr:glyoxylate/succinic semialdehyde reductase 1-like isoform X2 [Anneissia japonica]